MNAQNEVIEKNRWHDSINLEILSGMIHFRVSNDAFYSTYSIHNLNDSLKTVYDKYA